MPISYLALLRGINVGGRNTIRMRELAQCFEAHGYSDVRTYIQSGNVLFDSDEPDRAALTADIERMLGASFEYRAVVCLRTGEEMRAAVVQAPAGFGARPDAYRSDVLFLLPPLTPTEVLSGLVLREGVDEAHAGTQEVYFQRLAARAAQSRLSRIASLPMYQRMTIRSWSTTIKLLALMEEHEADRPPREEARHLPRRASGAD